MATQPMLAPDQVRKSVNSVAAPLGSIQSSLASFPQLRKAVDEGSVQIKLCAVQEERTQGSNGEHSTPTTMIVRRIPWSFTQSELLEEWPIDGTFDYLHFPYSRQLGRSVGVAIINFVTPQSAEQFAKQWHGHRLTRHSDSAARPLSVAPALYQGRNANLRVVEEDATVLPIVLLGDELLSEEKLLDTVCLAKRGLCFWRL
mmetsp:Transcript_72218/g.225199  ORF Transcript_72218/g.225199 Transcript_72218/m.225199 type:complete len:201 (+) Transcript_72218:52-654(+)